MLDLAGELARWGPDADSARPTPAAAADYTKALARTHDENFPVLSWFVPAELRPHFANVYAYCRWSDDLADEVADGNKSLALLDWWEVELGRCYAGNARHPVMVALAETVRQFDIPQQTLADLLVAFRRDRRQNRYATFAELLEYCRYSANPVGRLVLQLARRANPANFDLSDSICTGLQLVNFWQDVAIDWGKGRVYLPREDMTRFNVCEADLATGRISAAFQELLAFETKRAADYLHRGLPLAKRMPGRLKIVVGMFARGGLTILRKLRRCNFDVFSRRPTLDRRDVPFLALRTAWGLIS